MKKCVFIFRRDLRLTDNITLILSLKKFDIVLPIFIFDINQIRGGNIFFINLLFRALADLSRYLELKGKKLHYFYGTPEKVIDYLATEYSPAAVAFNEDYSYYSAARDKKIAEVCARRNIELFSFSDECFPYKNINYTGHRYSDFSIFVNAMEVKTYKNGCTNYDVINFTRETTLEAVKVKIKFKKIENTTKRICTRRRAMKSLQEKNDNFGISFCVKMGILSEREIYLFAKEHKKEHLQRQIIWRAFYLYIWKKNLAENRNNYDFYDDRFKAIQWRNDPEETNKLWNGETGIPIIDEAVRELNETGFMDNYSRLAVGFYSVKILRINPFSEWGGQKYFSSKLIDCCYINNTGNWHWVASDLLDASGQRFGQGWSGRRMSLFSAKEKKDEKYKKAVEFCKLRWLEWVEITK
jgi:deoxyribodipyrimidine photo-lyase